MDDQVDEKALCKLRGVIRTSYTTLNGRPTKISMPLPPRQTGRHLNAHHWPMAMGRAVAMVYSYTQISQYLRCPRIYRYRIWMGWREKETRAAMVFGRCFEKALGAYFCQEDSAAVLFKEWDAYRDAPFEFRKGESWDRLFHQGGPFAETFARDNRVRIRNPKKNLQNQNVAGTAGRKRIRLLP